MSTAHLSKGSSIPPKTKDLLRLYSMLFCPYAERARIVLKVKNIPHEIVNIDLKNKPEWYLDLNPEGKVPALDTGSKILTESLVISDYLDETYPQPPLYPADSAAVKKDKELINTYESLIRKFYEALFNKDNSTFAKHFQNALPEIETLEKELSNRGTLFFGGDGPKMADYMLWPWAERVIALPLLYPNEKVPVAEDSFPKLRAWYGGMQKQPIIQEIQISPERTLKLIQQYKSGQVDYDSI